MSARLSLAITEDCRLASFPSRASGPIHHRVTSLWLRFARAHRQRRILGLIALLWLFGAIDLLLTLWADRFTIFYEANPIARAMLANGMTNSVVLLKVATLAGGSVMFWWARHRRWTEGILWTLTVGSVVLMFQWSAYTANAEELVQYRQAADFAARPIDEDLAYVNLWRRARQAERAERAAAAAAPHPLVPLTIAAARPLHASSALTTFAGSTPVSRMSKPWYR